jgi:hypothetical protein
MREFLLLQVAVYANLPSDWRPPPRPLSNSMQ